MSQRLLGREPVLWGERHEPKKKVHPALILLEPNAGARGQTALRVGQKQKLLLEDLLFPSPLHREDARRQLARALLGVLAVAPSLWPVRSQ